MEIDAQPFPLLRIRLPRYLLLDGHLDQSRNFADFDFLELRAIELKAVLVMQQTQAFIVLNLSPELEPQILKLFLGHQSCGIHELVAVDLLRLTERVVETKLGVFETGLHCGGQSVDDKAVQIWIINFHDGARASTGESHFLHEVLVAFVAQSEGEDSAVFAVLLSLVDHEFRLLDFTIGKQEDSFPQV